MIDNFKPKDFYLGNTFYLPDYPYGTSPRKVTVEDIRIDEHGDVCRLYCRDDKGSLHELILADLFYTEKEAVEITITFYQGSVKFSNSKIDSLKKAITVGESRIKKLKGILESIKEGK